MYLSLYICINVMLVLRPFLLLMDHPQLVAGSHQSLSRLVAVSLPPQLESLTFGHDFNKELKKWYGNGNGTLLVV